MATYLFKEQEGAFLVGYVVAAMTKTNMVGFVGGLQFLRSKGSAMAMKLESEFTKNSMERP